MLGKGVMVSWERSEVEEVQCGSRMACSAKREQCKERVRRRNINHQTSYQPEVTRPGGGQRHLRSEAETHSQVS